MRMMFPFTLEPKFNRPPRSYMKFHKIAAVLLMSVMLSAQTGQAADAATEIRGVVTQIQTKLKAGQNSEAQLAAELKEFDALIAKYKASAPEDAAQAAFMKAILYVQVFEDTAKGSAMITQIGKDFPETKVGKQVPQVLASIKKMEESQKAQSALKVGAQFPDFSEKDLNGKPLSIAQYKGKVVLVDFWATWCGPCIGELPNVKAAYQKYHKDGFEIIGISLDSDKAKLTSFLAKENMTWPQYFDGKGWQNKVSTSYGINSIPATFLLDGTGKIIAKDLRGPALEAAVAKALKK